MRLLITLCIFSLWSIAYGQSSTCGDPSPLCNFPNYDFPLGSNVAIASGNNYGCIPHSPLPSVMGYYYAEIRAAGPITLRFSSANNLSVAAWGPFPSVAAAAGSCGSLPAPVACSANIGTNAESITFSGQTGEVFLIFVKGSVPPAYVGQFSVTQTNLGFPGTGGLACLGFTNETIVCPSSISITECDQAVPPVYNTAFEFVAGGGNVDNLCTDRIALTVAETENGGLGCAGDPRILERRYWLQDQCGNIATCTQQIFYPILDDPLELSCPLSNAPTQLVTCLDELIVNVEDISALNACGVELSFDIGEPVINDASLGVECDLTCLHYPVTVTDECGRSAVCTLSFTVFGNIPEFVYDIEDDPTICRVAPLEINCRDGIETSVENWLDTLSVFSTCGNRMNLQTDFEIDNFVDVCTEDVFQSQEIIITARDACGRINTCFASINLTKTDAPNIASQAKDKWVNCSENVDSIFQDYIDNNGFAIAFDYCSSTTFTTNPTNPQYTISCAEENGLSIEFIASDACGNTNITTGVFKVINDSAPSIVSEAMDIEVECNDDVVTAFENFINSHGGAEAASCGNVTWTTEPTIPTLPTLNAPCDVASTTVIFIGTDECEQELTTSATFTLNDNTPPEISGGADLDIECGDNSITEIQTWLNNSGALTATDVCSEVTLETDFDIDMIGLDDTCYEDPITVTFTATDACGNVSTETLDINITDNTPPVFTFVPSTISEIALAEDACSEVIITVMDENNGGQTIRTYTATDACGNSTSASVTFGDVDNTPPVITNIPTTIGCDGVLDPNDITATDDSGQVTVTVNLVSSTGTCATGYTYIYEVVATDVAGNSTSESVTYNIPADNTPPVFTFVPENLTFFCSEGVDIPMAIATDECDEVTITFVESLNDGAVVDDCNNGFGYDIFRTWTATDACGNTTTAITEAWVVPDDYVGPRFEFVPEDMVMDCGENATFGEAVCTTACGEVILTYVDEVAQGDCTQEGQMIRTWTGVDDCGNVSTAQQIISIPADVDAPIFTFVPASLTIKAMEDLDFGTPICEDNCATISHLDIDFVDTPLEEDCGMTRTWTVADLCGNASESSQTFYFDDTEAPSASEIPSMIVEVCGANVDFSEPNFTDNMGEVEVLVSDDQSENNCTGLPIQIRTWTATDICGNVSTFTQTKVVEDTALPVFEDLIKEKTITCTEGVDFDQAIATDACTEVSSLTFEDEDLASTDCTDCISAIRRTWTAADACGNHAQIDQTIFVKDLEAPSITLSAANTVEIDCSSLLEIYKPNVSDDCSEVMLTFEDLKWEDQCTDRASFTRTWIATDAVGNQRTLEQTYKFVDQEAPIFSDMPSTLVLTCQESFEFEEPLVTDGCSDVSLSFVDQNLLAELNVLTKVERTWTATDACGNASEFVQTMSVEDNTAPAFSALPSELILTCGQPIPAPITMTATDDCDSDVRIIYNETYIEGVECKQSSFINRSWIATDDAGNESLVSHQIEIAVDNEGPDLDAALSGKEITCGEEFIFDIPVFTDKCSSVSMTFSDDIVEDACEKVVSRYWSATDACGNVASTVQAIRWTDQSAPLVLTELEDLEMTYQAYSTWSAPAALDAADVCGTVHQDRVISSNEDCNDFSYTYRYDLADDCGNAISTSFSVRITDAYPSFSLSTLENIECGQVVNISAMDIDPTYYDFDWTLTDPSGTWEIVSDNVDNVEILVGDASAEIGLSVTNSFGCFSTKGNMLECSLVNSVKDITAVTEFNLSPNPVQDLLNVHFTSAEFMLANITVYDLLGRGLYQTTSDILVGENKLTIATNDFEAGTYILEIATDQGSEIKKFMKF